MWWLPSSELKRRSCVTPGAVGVDDDHRRALALDFDQRGQERGIGAAGDIGLAPGDDQFVTLDTGPGGAGRVGRFGEGEAGALVAGQQRLQVRAAQRFGHAGEHARVGAENAAQVADTVAGQGVARHQQGQGRGVVGLGEAVNPRGA
jgi:hypothetical protein